MNEIFWIDEESMPRLAIVLRPRGGDWLEDELRRIKQSGIECLVSLLEAEEASELGLDDEGTIASEVGLSYLSFPIKDRNIPSDTASFQSFVNGIVDRLRAGQPIGVHCRGSIGRATVTAACALVQMGWTPSVALKSIEAARGCTVPDTQEQRDWIIDYEVQP